MSANTDQVIARILEAEGGIADVGDGKGVTRFGQTQDWLDRWGFLPPATVADAVVNYELWLHRTRLAEVAEIDVTLGYLTADFAVHSGEDPAIKALQRAVGVKADGVIGSVTLGAIQRMDTGKVTRAVLGNRTRLIGDLLASTKVDRRKWARGWCNRLATQIETLA